LWPDGTVRWHERKSRRVRDGDGHSQVTAGVTFDVTEREEAAQALRESEERFRLIAEHARDLIALLDVDGCFRYLSPSCKSLLGYTPEDLLGRVASTLIDADDWPDGRKWGLNKPRELRMRKADGSYLWVEVLSYKITGEAGAQFALIARDVSERKQREVQTQLLEDELRQAQKMEAVGQLAGGIAHDFNNLLTVISGYTEILLRRLGPEADGRHEIAEISNAAERAARLTCQLLAYSRKQILEPRVLNLNDVVSETRDMLERVIGEDIEFSIKLAEDLRTISADEGQIAQIIMNLVVNARDAMPNGGTLQVVTGNAVLADAPAGRRLDVASGEYVVLTVSDTGVGIDAASAARVFEPYYTTKERGAGTGLGLATVYGIVKQSGGHVEFDSERGLGTTFRLYFPQVAAEAVALTPKPLDERPLMGSETVLLVEDDEALRGVGRDMLEMYGYTVLLAGDGVAALDLSDKYPGAIDLLMTDILMPKMGGIELAQRLSALRPQLKTLYTSGYNGSAEGAQRLVGARYLQKPYGMEELARTLRELLDSHDQRVAGSPPEGPASDAPRPATILVVDDDRQVSELIRSLVEARGDRCLLAGDIAVARRLIAEQQVQLVLCDVGLPGESGVELVRWLQRECPTVAVVMVTASDDPRLAETLLSFGVYGYIIKPFRTNDVVIAIEAALRRRTLELATAEDRGRLENAVVERTAALARTVAELADARDGLRTSAEETIHHLALAAEFRDDDTGRHVARVSRSAALIAERLGFAAERCELLRLASQLHDIGKIGIPDEILRKAGPLSAAERAVMEEHVQIGHRILQNSPSPLLQAASVIALSHHERWDGSGYPNALAGELIPVEGRIVAIADVFDALTHPRPYRPAYSLVEATATVMDGKGTQFDPQILALLGDSLDDLYADRLSHMGDSAHGPSVDLDSS
jgi:PAS domain S-box-containing protein